MLPKLTSPLLPWAALGVTLLLASTAWFAYEQGYDKAVLEQEAEEARVMRQHETLQMFIAEEISKIKVENKTILKRMEREIVKEPVYLGCRHTSDGLRAVNDALRAKADATANSRMPGESGSTD